MTDVKIVQKQKISTVYTVSGYPMCSRSAAISVIPETVTITRYLNNPRWDGFVNIRGPQINKDGTSRRYGELGWTVPTDEYCGEMPEWLQELASAVIGAPL